MYGEVTESSSDSCTGTAFLGQIAVTYLCHSGLYVQKWILELVSNVLFGILVVQVSGHVLFPLLSA